MEYADLLVAILLFVLGAGLFPTINNAILATNMTAWTFTGHELAASILSVFQYIYLVTMITIPLAIIFKRIERNG
jgi:hypothetical protein